MRNDPVEPGMSRFVNEVIENPQSTTASAINNNLVSLATLTSA